MYAFIYALVDPREPMILRYIGKANNPTDRYKRHLAKAELQKDCHRTHWVKSLLSQGITPDLLILQSVSVDIWQETERAYIESARALGFPLVNETGGGEGTVHPTDEWKKKQSEGVKRDWESRPRTRSKSAIEKQRKAIKEWWTPERKRQRGEQSKTHWTPERRKQQAEILRKIRANRKPLTDEQRKKLSERTKNIWKFGTWGTEAYREKRREISKRAHKRGCYGEEWKKKLKQPRGHYKKKPPKNQPPLF